MIEALNIVIQYFRYRQLFFQKEKSFYQVLNGVKGSIFESNNSNLCPNYRIEQ
jgi:hypothetical protein